MIVIMTKRRDAGVISKAKVSTRPRKPINRWFINQSNITVRDEIEKSAMIGKFKNNVK